MAEQRLPIDENHATDHAAQSGGPAPARGWIVAMEARPDGIWGQVEWTPDGQAMMAARAYRGISPVFTHTSKGGTTKGGQVLRLLRAALTNAPNLKQLKTLHTQGTTMDDLEELREALSLPDTASMSACIAAVRALFASAGQGQAAQTQHRAETERLAGELVTLQTELHTMRQAAARERAVVAVDGAMRAGKPIPKALRDHYIARHMENATAVELELAGLPSLHSGGITAPPVADGAADANQIALQAQALVDREAAAGRSMNFGVAVMRVTANAG